tara:strand:- start:317 stop:1504 length:1188 start_codon:yes stop_codon:yes gene_type:complete
MKKISKQILPPMVVSLNLKEKLEKYDEKKHLLNVAKMCENFFLKQQKKKENSFFASPETLKIAKNWIQFGNPMTTGVLSYEEVLQKVLSGKPDTFMGYLPNNIIYGISLWNRTDHINFKNVFNNLDAIGGMDWNSLHITTVYFKGKFITVIGNHCIVKTIIMLGYGALIPCKIVYVGDTNEDIQKFMSRMHDIDASKRTNMNIVDRLVSQGWSGDEKGEEKMKIIISLGYNIKNQVVPTKGEDLLKISSVSYLLDYVQSFGYDVVEYVTNLMKDVYKGETHQSFCLGIFAQTYVMWKDVLEEYNKRNQKEGADILKTFLELKSEQGEGQKEFMEGSGEEKSLLVHSMRLIKKLNAFCKSDAAFNKGYEKRRFNLITKKMLLEKVPEDKIPQIIDL